MKVYIAIVDQKYPIQAVGSTRKEAVDLAGRAWRRFWKGYGHDHYANWKELLADGGCPVHEIETGRAYVDWSEEA